MRLRLLEGADEQPSVTGGLAVKLPVGSRAAVGANPGLDLCASVATGLRVGSIRVHGWFGVTWFEEVQADVVRLERIQTSAMLAVEVPATRRTSLLLQTLVASPAMRDFAGFSRPTTEVTLGAKHRLRDDLVVEFGVVENLFVYSNSSDVAFHFGLEWRHASWTQR